MATKAELEAAHARYRDTCAAAARAEADRDFHAAVRAAADGLPLVHSAVAFQRRFLKVEPDAPTLDVLFRYAPPLFLGAALSAAEHWYAGGTRTERGALPDVPERLAAARRRLTRAAELWAPLAASSGARLTLDGRDTDADEVVAVWLSVGAVRAAGGGYARTSDPRRPARGKCSACGGVLAAPLAKLLDPFPCPACRQPRPFVIVGRLE